MEMHAHSHTHGDAHRPGPAHSHAPGEAQMPLTAHTHAAADNERRLFLDPRADRGLHGRRGRGGIAAGSLALLADAGHMLTEPPRSAFAWTAFRIGRRPQDARRSLRLHRFQVLAAFVNGADADRGGRLDRDRGRTPASWRRRRSKAG